MRKILPNNQHTKKKLDKLPKIFLVVRWAKYAVMEFPLAGWKKENKVMIPLVYHYYDCNGECDQFNLTQIYNTTSGGIVCWTDNFGSANRIVEALNLEEAHNE